MCVFGFCVLCLSVCFQIVWGVLTNGVFSKCVGCFNKWYVFKLCGGVFTNSVFLQIVWMSVCVVQIRWVRPTPYWSVRGKNCEQMHLEIIQSILPDMSAMWVSQVQCELSEYYPDIRICIHMSCQVLSNLLDKAVYFNSLENWFSLESTIFWCTFSRYIHKKLGHVWSPNGWTVLCFTCQIYWQSGIQEFWIYILHL